MNDYPDTSSEDREVSALSLPPHSMEAEQSVLGGLLLENSAWDRIADVVTGEDFYRHEHRLKIFSQSLPKAGFQIRYL